MRYLLDLDRVYCLLGQSDLGILDMAEVIQHDHSFHVGHKLMLWGKPLPSSRMLQSHDSNQ